LKVTKKIVLVLLFVLGILFSLNAQSDVSRARIALFEPAGQRSDAALTAVLATVADSVELSLDVLQRYEVRRLPSADPAKDLPRVKAYCQANRMDQAIMGSGSAKSDGGYLFKLVVYDRRSDTITLAPEGSSKGALDMFDVTDKLVGTLLDGLSGTHLLFGSLSVESDPPGATVSVNGKEVGTAPVSLRGLPAEAVQVSAKLPGREDVNTSVTITDGETTDAPLSLARSTGTLSLTMPKDAVVTVSSAETGKKDLSGPGAATLPTGDYDAQASCPGMPAVSRKVTVSRNAATSYLPWPKGYLDVQAVPAGATIVVDGVERGVAPLVVDVEPGTLHHVELKLAKYETYTGDVSAPAGDKTSLAPALLGLPGAIRVEISLADAANTTVDYADISLDDKSQHFPAPATFSNVRVGSHIILIADIQKGNRIYTAGGPVQLEVKPGDTTLVSKTLVQGKATLLVADAPEGSIIKVDDAPVDSVKALTTGIDIPAGAFDLSVESPGAQKWYGHTFAGLGLTTSRSVYELILQIPHRTIRMDGNPDDWAGLQPTWRNGKNYSYWAGQPGTKITKGYICRDDNYIYFKYEFSDGTPQPRKLSKQITELQYVQNIITQDGELRSITRFVSLPGTAGILGNQSSRGWTDMGRDWVTFKAGESILEVAVSLTPLKSFLKGLPSPVALQVWNVANGKLTGRNYTDPQSIDFGL
jgi:hypothetical protein